MRNQSRISNLLTFRGAEYHTRPNKLGTGMSKTHAPQGSVKEDKRDVLRLVVHGTTDILAGIKFTRKPSPRICECCGGRVPKFVLTDLGRAKLKRLKAKRGLL